MENQILFCNVFIFTTSRSRDVTNIAGFWSKQAPKTIEVNGNRVEFCFYFSMYRWNRYFFFMIS